MDRRWIALALGGLLITNLGGCEPPEDVSDSTILPFSDLAYGDSSGITSERLEVVRDSASFSNLWAEHARVFLPEPTQPEVDFEVEMVIAAFFGTKSTSGYWISVTEVEEQSDSLSVRVEATQPGANCVLSTALTQPHHMIAVARSDKPVVFDMSLATVDCP